MNLTLWFPSLKVGDMVFNEIAKGAPLFFRKVDAMWVVANMDQTHGIGSASLYEVIYAGTAFGLPTEVDLNLNGAVVSGTELHRELFTRAGWKKAQKLRSKTGVNGIQTQGFVPAADITCEQEIPIARFVEPAECLEIESIIKQHRVDKADFTPRRMATEYASLGEALDRLVAERASKLTHRGAEMHRMNNCAHYDDRKRLFGFPMHMLKKPDRWDWDGGEDIITFYYESGDNSWDCSCELPAAFLWDDSIVDDINKRATDEYQAALAEENKTKAKREASIEAAERAELRRLTKKYGDKP